MSSLAATVAHAVDFLTRPLLNSYAPATIVKLQLVLEANLTALYAQSWVISDPPRGSARRCLSLSPDCLPPQAVYAACIAAGVQWFDWIALLGGYEFDFFVDPGRVSMRLVDRNASNSRLITVWADPALQRSATVLTDSRRKHSSPVVPRPGKTLAQQLLEDDAESDDHIFTMIDNEIRAPTWMTPVVAEFPKQRSLSPLSAISSHSRCSSRSSNSSSGFSFSSADSSSHSSVASRSASSSASATSSQRDENGHPKQSRRERARQARVFVDTTRTEVTPYDGGKTTVLTGGVMLGGGNAKKAPIAPRYGYDTNGWRSAMRM